MSETLKLRYKVGEIEFEAEGSPETVEKQRINFMNGVLPAAVDAMVQTHQSANMQLCIEPSTNVAMLEVGSETTSIEPSTAISDDLSRTSLASFLKPYGSLTEQNFTLFSAYFDEAKNNNKKFSIEEVKRYYSDARRVLPQNPSMSLTSLAKKGLIMDTLAPDDAKPGKYYMLTDDGINYIKNYIPKENKTNGKATKSRKTISKQETTYASITADDLNLKNYPLVKTFKGSKEQIILAMYIVTNENKGEWFTVDDIIYLMKNIFELPCTRDMVRGIITRNASFFQNKNDENNKRALSYKLLSGAKDFAESLIEQFKQ